MEKMPFHEHLAGRPAPATAVAAGAPSTHTVSTDWRQQLPVLRGSLITLRELELRDAPSLLAMLSTEEVARFISPPPTTVEGFERFITWAQQQRQRGEYVCFAVVPHGMTVAVGLFQIRRMDSSFGTAEWGFALGSVYWGTGMFVDGARMAVDFAINIIGVHRLEARACIANSRGNGALRKMGAVQEGVLRQSFFRNGRYLDQVLWSIVDTDWLQAKRLARPKVRIH
jgi:[ribosomal protein S5]-alanine N-acetyltransferase